VYIAKRLVVFTPKFAEKSPFLNARLVRGVLLAVSFSLQTSTTMASHACGKDCLLANLWGIFDPILKNGLFDAWSFRFKKESF
jgi:hypothetical protein